MKQFLRWIILGGTLFFLARALKDNWIEVTAIRIHGVGWAISDRNRHHFTSTYLGWLDLDLDSTRVKSICIIYPIHPSLPKNEYC